MANVVLVTGVGRPMGVRLAARLVQDGIARVIGVDTVTPPSGLPDGVEFLHADIRSPAISMAIRKSEVDTVVHLNITGAAGSQRNRAATKELNVIGTMRLLAACQRADGVRKLVMRSSTGIYGSSARSPALFAEDTPPVAAPRGYGKDMADIESYLRSFERRRPDVAVTVLRLANLLPPAVDTPMTRYLSLRFPPTVIGFDPRLQFLHLDDCLNVLLRATTGDHPGVFNVAGAGVLLLSQAIRRAGRVPAAVPRLAAPLLDSVTQLRFSAELLQFLTYGRVVNTTRLHTDFGYTPRFSTSETLDEFVRGRQLTPVVPAAVFDAAERVVRAVVQ